MSQVEAMEVDEVHTAYRDEELYGSWACEGDIDKGRKVPANAVMPYMGYRMTRHGKNRGPARGQRTGGRSMNEGTGWSHMEPKG